MFGFVKKSLFLVFLSVFLLTGCNVILNPLISPDQYITQVRLNHKEIVLEYNYYTSNAHLFRLANHDAGHELYLNGKLLDIKFSRKKNNKNPALRTFKFHITDSKIRWFLYDQYKQNGKLCFKIKNTDKNYFISNIKKGGCFINHDLEEKFSIDYANSLKEGKVNKSKLSLKAALQRSFQIANATGNPYFNKNINGYCSRPNILPISPLCGTPQKEIDRLTIDCLRPLGKKACRYMAGKVNDKNITEKERKKRKVASTVVCNEVIGGDISGADIADELGDELTSSDSTIANMVGWLAEGYAAIATTATVSSCLNRLNMYCDVNANSRKNQAFEQCKKEVLPYKDSIINVMNKRRDTNLLMRQLDKREVFKSKNYIVNYDKLFIKQIKL